MLLALGAAASALDALQSLTSSKSKSPQPTGFDQSSTNPFDITTSSTQTGSQPPVVGGAGFTQISPATMSTLLAAQGQASTATTTSTASTTSASSDPSGALKDLFSQIDTNGDGQISKSEFENALGAGGTNIAQADDVFNKLDANGDGSVSLDEMSKALQGAGGKGGHHHHHVADSDGSNSTSSTSGTSGTSGASSSSSGAGGSNSDALLQALNGASSTSVTNSDGSTTTSITNADGSIITMTSPAATTSSSSATASYNFLEQMIQRAAQAISSGANASLSMSV